MVRFSDMLGSSGDADEPSAPTAARDRLPEVDEEAELDARPAPGTVQFVDQVGAAPPAAPVEETAAADRESPQDVLDRLTQYASSARAAERAPLPEPPTADPAPPPPSPPAAREPDAAPRPSADPEQPAGDDILPRAKRPIRKPGRGDKRRP